MYLACIHLLENWTNPNVSYLSLQSTFPKRCRNWTSVKIVAGPPLRELALNNLMPPPCSEGLIVRGPGGPYSPSPPRRSREFIQPYCFKVQLRLFFISLRKDTTNNLCWESSKLLIANPSIPTLKNQYGKRQLPWERRNQVGAMNSQ